MRLVGHALEEPWLAIIGLAALVSGPVSMEAVGEQSAPQKASAQVRGAPVRQEPASCLCQAFALEFSSCLNLLLHPKWLLLL